MDIKEKIKNLSGKYSDDITALRRNIHQNPELSFNEFSTTALIERKLKKLNLDKIERLSDTGVVGLLRHKKRKAKCVALRADIDALPILEDTGLSFSSKRKGIMHACGHDAHSAMLYGAARILTDLRNELNGSIKFIFQPGEEKNPGGASVLIRNGVLKNPDVNAIFGQHIITGKRSGSLGFYPGVMMASQDELYIKIIGKTGHGAKPHTTIDPIAAASHVVVALQNIVSRNTDPYDPLVITIGKFEGGTATNIIPGEVNLAGTIRTLNSSLRKKSLRLIDRTIKGICDSFGAKYEFNIKPGYPELNNDKRLTAFAKTAAEEFTGGKNVFEAEHFMGAEDFAYYLKKVPGTFYRIGVGETTDIHTPTMNLDEKSLAAGSGFMAYLAFKYLEQQ